MTNEQQGWLNEIYRLYDLVSEFYFDEGTDMKESREAFRRDYSDFTLWQDMFDDGMTPKQALREEMSNWSR